MLKNKEYYLTNYLLYAFKDKLDKIPEWMLFDNWNKKILYECTINTECSIAISTYSYAFDIYY